MTLADKKLFASLILAPLAAALAGGCSTVTRAPNSVTNPSWTEKVTTTVSSGTSKVTSKVASWFNKKPAPGTETEEVGNHKAGPGVYVAIAQIKERNGDLEEAEIQYQKALEMDPDHLNALMGYARLEDGRNNFEAATKHYQRAIKKHPKEGQVYNDLGLCYHRRGKLKDAAKSLEKAIELQPARRLYHDNLAAVLVDQDKTDEALKQLVAAHGEAVGHYNLAFLLTQKKNNKEALPHFRKALEKDPSLDQARDWIAQLSPPRKTVVEPLPPTTRIAERPQATTPQRKKTPAPTKIASKSQRPDKVIRATANDSNSKPDRIASRQVSDLHFLPSQDDSDAE
jgi:tetratricopeptide (TPR) repeat protein